MSDAEERVPKSNGVTSNPLQRLASFKTPRDLSLGGVKPNKKVFLPNLNVTRNKSKGIALNSKDRRKDDKNKRDRKSDRNKNLKNGPGNVIKSGGVFAEGVGGVKERNHNRTSLNQEAESSPTIKRPIIRVKDVVKIDRELEERRIKSSVSCSTFNNDYEVEDFKNDFTKHTPIRLPMDDSDWSLSKARTKAAAAAKLKNKIVIKEEPTDCDSSYLFMKPKIEVKEEVYDHSDVVDLLRSKQSSLILIQFPGTLPGRGSVDDETPRPMTSEAAASSTLEDIDEDVEKKCHLNQLEEGRVGNMRIHRSGRVTFAFGDTEFEVNMGTKTAFRQEAVTLGVDDASRSASVVVLGPLLHKLAIVPQWDQMFADMI